MKVLENGGRSISLFWVSNVVLLIASTYVVLYCGHIFISAPATFRADYLNHVVQLVQWDRDKAYASMLRFVFEFQSGHILAVQKVFNIGNFYIFKCSALVSKILGIFVMLVYWSVHARSLMMAGTRPAAALGVLVFSFIMFSPHGYEVYSWTDSIPAHYPTALFALLSLIAMSNAIPDGQRLNWKYAVLAVTTASLSVLSNGSGWAILPILTGWVLFARREHIQSSVGMPSGMARILSLSVLVGGIAFVAFWVLAHANAGQRISGLNGYRLALNDPLAVVKHFLALVVSPWAQFEITVTWKLGLVLIVMSVWCGFQTWLNPTKRGVIWFAYSSFGLIACAMVAITRFDRDIYLFGSVSSRYSVYALPIYAGLFGMAVSLTAVKRPANKPTIRVLWRWAVCAAFFVPATTLFAKSWARAFQKETYQNREMEISHTGTVYWNLKSAFRLSSTYELPSLYLETLPLLKAAGRANVLTEHFVPAEAVDDNVAAALRYIKTSPPVDLRESASCNSAGDGVLRRVLMDERFQPRIRRLGVSFVRLIGYFRNPEACDTALEYVIALAKDSTPLCTSKSGVYVWDDLPRHDQIQGVMDTPFVFDFSCPLLHSTEVIFPIRVYGFSSQSKKAYLIGVADMPDRNEED